MNWDRRIGYWIKKKTIDIYVAGLLFAFNSSNWKSMGTMWLFTFPPQQTPNWAEYIHRNIIRRSWYWPLQTFIWCPMFNVHLFQDGDQRLVVILNEAKIGDYSFSRFHKSVEYIFFCSLSLSKLSPHSGSQFWWIHICQLIATQIISIYGCKCIQWRIE